MARPKPLLLAVELVPKTVWNKSLRELMPRRAWDKHRTSVLNRAGNKCEICGSPKKLHCHEVWHYTERTRIQKLVDFMAICEMCHFVKHIARARQLAAQGHLDFPAVIAHFKKVNKVGDKELRAHLDKANRTWEKRSTHEWQTDFGKFKHLLPTNAA